MPYIIPPRLAERLVDVVVFSQTAQPASIVTGDVFEGIGALRQAAFLLHHTLGSPGVGHTLNVSIEFSPDKGTTWLQYATFATITNPTTPTQFQMYQIHQGLGTDGSLLTNGELTATIGAGIDKWGSAAGPAPNTSDFYPFGPMRVVGNVGGATAFTYNVRVLGVIN
jgi:hypothetical protein